jgi:hypothetical protein
MKIRILVCSTLLLGSLPGATRGLAQVSTPETQTARILQPNGIPTDPDFFPIAVWVQNPRNAVRYKAAGINLYVGLWKGPTQSQLAELEQAGMPVICAQNETALAERANPIIAGWMHGDEPDNAQPLRDRKGYGPPILPSSILQDYRRMRAADGSRPVLLNLGQGVAWDNYIGRGTRRNHPEDYAEYVKGCDIASFDIYPVVHESPEVAGKLEFVAQGVERLMRWTGGAKPVWNCIECTHISNPNQKATPEQLRSEVWGALIRGSRGLIYFVHQFKPVFKEAALLEDAEMLAAVTALNGEIQKLAPVLNSPTIQDAVAVRSDGAENGSIASMMKQVGDEYYLFAANLKNERVQGTFTLRVPAVSSEIEVIGESRALAVEKGGLADEFAPYAVHLYRWKQIGKAARPARRDSE